MKRAWNVVIKPRGNKINTIRNYKRNFLKSIQIDEKIEIEGWGGMKGDG